jgi:predicted methyltransferase
MEPVPRIAVNSPRAQGEGGFYTRTREHWSVMAESASKTLADAVADKARPEADRARDADRKPAEVIALTGIHPGAKVAEMLPGGGYFTRIFSKLLGPQGTLYAWMNLPATNAAPGGRDPAAAIRALAADPNYRNIRLANLDPSTPLPEKVDLVWTSLNYHDMKNRPGADLVAINRMVFDALKPGGLYMVIDHAAERGSGARDTQARHRIDPELVFKEVTAAGFKLLQQSELLKNAADDHTRSSHDVERGKTDQFVLLFQRPA